MIIINQSTGSLFNSLVSALAAETEINFISGNYSGKLSRVVNRKMKAYNRESLFGRAFSWSVFSLQVIFYLLFSKPQPVFVVTNPPFSLFAVWLVSLVKKFSYSILVYDLYPDIIHETEILKPDHIVIRIWEGINKIIFKKAEVIFTISEGMKDKIRKYSQLIKFVTDRPGHDFRYAINSSKLRKQLKWLPKENFESGIKKTIKWYLKNNY